MYSKTMAFLHGVVNSSAPAANPDDAVYANVVNVSSLFGIGITVFYTLFYLLLDARQFFPIIFGNLFIIPCYLIPISINRRGFFYLAKIAFFPIPFFQMVFDTGILGRDAGTHLFLLALPSLGLLMFKHEETRSTFLIAAISGLLFAACHYFFPAPRIPPYSGLVEATFFVFSISGMLGLQYLAIYIFSHRLKTTKDNLQVALDYMPGGMMALDQNQDVMLANSRINDLYNLPPDHIKEGNALREIIEQVLNNGGTNEAGDPFPVDGTLALFSGKDISSVVLNTWARC